MITQTQGVGQVQTVKSGEEETKLIGKETIYVFDGYAVMVQSGVGPKDASRRM